MNKLEAVLKDIQPIVNNCVYKEYSSFAYSFSSKLEHVSREQAKTAVDAELTRTTDELMVLLRANPILRSLANWVDNPDFLLESTFIETLSTNEKKKYTGFNTALLNCDTYKNPAAYDNDLPYFSLIIRFSVISRYIDYLKGLINIDEEPEPTSEPEQIEPDNIPIAPIKVEKHGDFESNFENWQIDILTKCVNEVRIFQTPITSKTMKNILLCKLKEPLQVAKFKNKMLAYFLSELDARSYIVRDWQSVCAKNELFISSGKGIILQQGNFSSAVSQNNEFPPKDCHIIDNYIKQLKGH